MANIAVISGGMIPYVPVWGGIQRVYFLASHLERKGHKVVVIHPQGQFIGNLGKEIHFKTCPIPFRTKLLQKSFERFRNFPTKEANGKSKKTLGKYVGNTIRFFDVHINGEPSPGIGFALNIWNHQVYKQIIRILVSENIHVVIISAPPFSLFNLVPIIRKYCSRIKVIADYRDPWSVCINRSTRLQTKERKLLRLVNAIVTFSEAFSNDLRNEIRSYDIPVIASIYNGYSESDWKRVENEFHDNTNNNVFVVAHIGTMNRESPGRNPSNLIRAFEKFSEDKKRNVKLKFVGGSNDLIASSESIEIIPRVSHNESLSYMLKSNLLLIIHTSISTAKYAVTGKLFDYMRSGVPIVGIGFQGTAVRSLIEDNGFVCDNNSEEILEILEEAYKRWRNGQLLRLGGTEERISHYSRESQNDKYERIILSLLEEGDIR